jgi:hypothetical protein
VSESIECQKLYNILKGISISIIVYLDLKHYELEQCNGSSALTTKSCKGSRIGLELSFHWDAFGIAWMDEKKMTTSSFGGAVMGVSQVGAPT